MKSKLLFVCVVDPLDWWFISLQFRNTLIYFLMYSEYVCVCTLPNENNQSVLFSVILWLRNK